MIAPKSFAKSLFLLIVLSVSTAGLSRAQSTKPVQKAAEPAVLDTTNYSVKIPTSWRHFDKAAGEFTALYIMAPPVNNFSPNVNIIGTPTGNISMDEFFNGNMESMKAGNMAPDSSGDFETNGLKGKFYTTKVDYKGTSIAIKSYLLLHNGVGYVLTGACLTSQRKDYYPMFEDIVHSFKLK